MIFFLASSSHDLEMRIRRLLRYHEVILFSPHGALPVDKPAILIIDLATCTDLQQWQSHIPDNFPVLVLASSMHSTFVASLPNGWDYMILPLREAELRLRTDILYQRFYRDTPQTQRRQFGAFTFTLPSCIVTCGDKQVPLTHKECALAMLLLSHIGQPLSRATIAETVWGGQEHVSGRTIDTHISRIRNKLGLLPEQGYQLNPVYGYGYQLSTLQAGNHLTSSPDQVKSDE